MNPLFPDYLSVPSQELGNGTPVTVETVADMSAVADHMAAAMMRAVDDARAEGRHATFIIPVGPVDQFPVLAVRINQDHQSWRNVALINMDEYLAGDDQWIPADHPLSFRAYMDRNFYDLVDPELAPAPENRIFPDPNHPEAVQSLIDQRGGVDVCFGGIGINGHIAFNEPPEPGESMSTEAFAALPTRTLDITRETRTINSVTVGGEIAVIPRRAVTVGMKEILASRKLRFYCNRPWQSAVARRVLHGPVTAACPASLLRTHPDARLTITNFVAAPPDIRLR